LATALDKTSNWQTLPPTSLQRKTKQHEIQEEFHGLSYMLSEIDKSITAAEKNPQRFNLSQADISERRKWVMATQRKVESITQTLQQKPTPYKQTQTAKKELMDPTSKLNAAINQENDRFIQSEGERQQLLLRRQDDDLEDLASHVVRIGDLGREMGQELESQGQLLDELDADMDSTATRMAAAQKKVQAVLDRTGAKGQLIIIGALIVLLVILVVLVLS
jgi:syntaxin of plants SYP6